MVETEFHTLFAGVPNMILLLFCAIFFIASAKGNNVIPHIPWPYPPTMKAPMTLRDPIHPGTVVWISGLFHDNTYNNDLKIYVIAGGNGEFNDQMQACVLEIRAYHDEDRISYGSLSKWGGEWNYAADSKNTVRDGVQSNVGFDFVLEFKDNVIVVWANAEILSIYPYSATIHDLSEISGIHILKDDELEIQVARYLSMSEYGSFPYEATFDPPLSKEMQHLASYGLVHCSEYATNDVEYIFHNNSASKDFHFFVAYSCQFEWFAMQGLINGKIVGVQTAKYPASKVKNGIVWSLDVDGAQVKLKVNGEDLMAWPHQVDIEKYPVTNLDVIADNGRYSMTILTMIDDKF